MTQIIRIFTEKLQKISANQRNPYNLRSILFVFPKVSDDWILNKKPETRNRKLETAIIVILSLLPLLFFWRVITLNPADRLHLKAGDFTEQYFPLRAFSARAWVNGHVPLWNPHIFGGQPGLADIQSGALYPPHVLQSLALGWMGYGFPLSALAWQVIFHFSLVAVGAYLLGRYWARRAGASWRVARFVGAIVSLTFTYSGYLTGFPVQQMTILLASAWLPWVMLSLARALDAVADGLPVRVSLARAGWASLAFAMAVLAGHPQTAMYIFYLMVVYGVFQIASATLQFRRSKLRDDRVANRQSAVSRQSSRLTFLLSLFTILAFGGLIAAAQLLPTLAFIRQSLRADLSFSAVSQGLPLSEFVSVLYPGYFGGSPEYVGILPLLLIAAALTLSRRHLRGTIIFWVLVALGSLLLAFGANTFAYPLAYLTLPGFDAVRQQERIFLLYSFSLAVLTGYGALALAMPLPKAMRSAWKNFIQNANRVGAVVLALTGLYLYGAVAANVRGDAVNLFNGVLRHHIFGLIIYGGALLMLSFRPRRFWRRWWGMSLVAVWLVFNLFTINWQFNLERRDSEPFIPTGTVQFLREHTAGKSVRIASGGLLPGGNNAAMVFGLEDITGNTPLQLADVAAFSAEMPSWRLWQLLNVRYVLDTRDIDSEGLARQFEADGVKVFEVTDPFPRAWVVHRLARGDDWLAMAADDFDLKTTALVTVDVPVTETGVTDSVTVSGADAGLLALDVSVGADGLLVVSEIWDGGWRATVDGKPASLIRADGVLLGVPLSAGVHTVQLRYQPRAFRWGMWLSLAGLLAVLGLIAWGSRWQRVSLSREQYRDE